jgi:hypothetical protein
VQFSCVVCGRPFGAQKPTAKYCGPTCSKRGQRAGLASRRGAPVTRISPATTSPIDGTSDLVDAVRQTLGAAGRLDTSLGQLALILARKMTDYGTGGGVAALSRELSRVMDAALGPVEPSDDLVDELRRRRDRKRKPL